MLIEECSTNDWTGGVLVDFKKIVDQSTNQQPAPSALAASTAQQNDPALLGLAFDKTSPHNYNVN